jgi:hypothetical protein
MKKAVAAFVCLVLLLACADDPATPPASVGEAAWTVRIPVWHRFTVSLSVPGALRMATAPLGARLLDGRTADTRWGRVTVSRIADGVKLRCAPCAINVPNRPRYLHFVALELHLARQGQVLAGRVQIEQVIPTATQHCAAISSWSIPRSAMSMRCLLRPYRNCRPPRLSVAPPLRALSVCLMAR